LRSSEPAESQGLRLGSNLFRLEFQKWDWNTL